MKGFVFPDYSKNAGGLHYFLGWICADLGRSHLSRRKDKTHLFEENRWGFAIDQI